MIHAVIFDLDGTLVQTERLKALSYARAAVELSGNDAIEGDVIEAFKQVVGRSRQEVAQTLMQRFDLEQAATARMSEFEVSRPWQAFVQVRLQFYDDMLSDERVLQEHKCPYNVGLLEHVSDGACRTALATMSHCAQAQKVLRLLHLHDKFDLIASRDDVENGKPDPEIYLMVAGELAVQAEQCLVIEDSPSGARAARNAGMRCIVVTTDFTRRAIYESEIVDRRWIVDDPANLMAVAREVLDET